MPEMTTMPNLSSAPSPASAVRATSSTPISPNNSSIANAANTSNTSNTPQTPGSSADAGNPPDSFASVLQRQLAQSAKAEIPKPAAALLADLALQPRPIAALLPDLALQPKPEAALLADLALQPKPIAALLPDLALQPKPEAALLADLALQPKPEEAALLGDLALLPKSVASQGSKLTATPEDLATQEIPDDGLALLSPYLSSIIPNIPAKLDADMPATEKKTVAALAGDTLLTSAAALIQSHLSSDRNAAQAVSAEVKPETANKTAEFAALLASSADFKQSQTNHSESAATGTGAGFENLLAAQMVSQTRNGEVHSSSHTAMTLPIQTPVGAHGWDGEVSDKLVWMVGRQEQRAELVLNPPQLGRVEVSLSMNGDQTSAMFVSTNPAVRDALEAALPRLREILADAGINLGQAQVGSDTGNNAANQSANNRENRDNSSRGSSRDDSASGGDALRPVGVPQWLKQVNGMVDVFA